MENQPHRQPATPEEIWSILRSISEEQKTFAREREKRAQEMDKRMQEADQRAKEAEREMKELRESMKETSRQQKKTDRQIEETSRQLKETDLQLEKTDERFNSRWGKLVESLVAGDLVKLLQDKGIEVYSIFPNARNERRAEHWEFDIIAENGREAVVVEVKTTLRADDVRHFLKKLAKFTTWVPRFKGIQVYGAVAYLQVEQSADVYAEKQGLFVIRATGNSASIVNRVDFRPRVFD